MCKQIIFLVLFFIHRSSHAQFSISILPDSIKIITVGIKKVDLSKSENMGDKRVYELSIFNNSDSTICILGPDDLEGNVSKRIFSLDPAYECADTLRYYSLEHGQYWDAGYNIAPAKPLLISPSTYFKTFFAINFTSDNPTQFHIHFANVDIAYSKIINLYQADSHGWQKQLHLKCKQVKLPN